MILYVRMRLRLRLIIYSPYEEGEYREINVKIPASLKLISQILYYKVRHKMELSFHYT